MDNQEWWKLIKALFCKDPSLLEWLPLTYYNIIIVDIENLENQVRKGQEWGKKWWRPRVRETLGDINLKTPPLVNEKPKISKDKIKESKVNKDKVRKSKYGEYKNILLSDIEKNKLIEDYSESTFNKYIKILDEWIEMKWYKYKNHNLAIRNWINRDKEKWVVVSDVSNDYEKQKAERLKRYWIQDDWF